MSIFPKTITYMWPRGISGHSDPSNYISLFYKLTFLYVSFFHMNILVRVGDVVLYFYKIPVAAPSCRFYHRTMRNSRNRRSDSGGIIRPLMGPILVPIICNSAV